MELKNNPVHVMGIKQVHFMNKAKNCVVNFKEF